MAEGDEVAVALEPAAVTDGTAVAMIRDGLAAYNRRFIGPRDAAPLVVVARSTGRIVGGLVAETVRTLLEIDMLWLDEAHRGRGLGSRLLATAEAEAARRGCRMATLGTFDFQARPFYERQGYRLAGEVGGYPNGHRLFMLTKPLTPGPARAT